MNWVVPDEAPLDVADRTAIAAKPPPPSFWEVMASHFGGPAAHQADMAPAISDAGAAIGAAVPGAIHEISSPGFLHGLTQNIGASYDEGLDVNNTNADLHARIDAYQSVVDEVNKGLAPDQQLENPMYGAPLSNVAALKFNPVDRAAREARLWGAVAQLKKSDPGAGANLPANSAELELQMQDAQRGTIQNEKLAASESGPVSRTLGTLVGGGAASFLDPVNILAMGLGSPASSSLLRTFLLEGGLNTAADVVGLPTRISRLKRLGEPAPSAGDIALELGADFVLGGAIPVGGKVAGRYVSRLRNTVSAFDERFPNPDADARAARNAVADQARRAEDNPYADSDAGREEHRAQLEATTKALDDRKALPAPRELLPSDRAYDEPAVEAGGGEGGKASASDVLQAETDIAASTKSMPKPETLFGYIQRLGGIRTRGLNGKISSEGSDLVKILGGYNNTTRRLVRNKELSTAQIMGGKKSGMTAEDLLINLKTDRWLGPDADMKDMFELIDEHARGNKEFHPEDPMVFDLQVRKNLDEELHAAGIDPKASPKDRARALAEWRASESSRSHDAWQAMQAYEEHASLAPADLEELESHGYDPHAAIGDYYDTGEILPGSYGHGELPPGDEYQGAGVGVDGGPADRHWAADSEQHVDAAAQHPGARDGASLEGFLDPQKREAFDAQTGAIARELAPEVAEAEKPKGEDPQAAKSDLGEAHDAIAALKALPQDLAVPDMAHLDLYRRGDGPVTIKQVADELARDARAVEHLRTCVGGE